MLLPDSDGKAFSKYNGRSSDFNRVIDTESNALQ